ncbi:MAG: PAS domain-containing sensor histidine kinase [Sulfuricurvum sp.]|nr:PAS domain-containing sensor histidine kinase [Sulfuricurvum sp.]
MQNHEFFFKHLFEASPHPYLIVRSDESYTIVAVNDYYLNATGIIRENVVGKPLFEVFPDNPKDESVSGVSDLHISLDSVVRYAQTDIMGVQKYDIPLRDGSDGFEVKYWSPVNAPIVGEDGKVEYIIHNVEDVTDFILLKEATSVHPQTTDTQSMRLEAEVLKRANEVKEANRLIKAREKELAVLNDKLKELDRLKTEFFSNISHEFRTPLTLMLAPVEELLSNRPNLADDRIAVNIEIIHRNALRLLKLVNTLLDFSRIEAGRARAAYEATDLSALTADLASNFSSASELANVALIVDCPPFPEWVEVDREMWEKIVLNLLSNAFKFTHSGTITISTRSENGKAVLRVQDTGIGIPEEELPKLFERFYRVENAYGRSYEGTGIGLSLVQELVKLQGGDYRGRQPVRGGDDVYRIHAAGTA